MHDGEEGGGGHRERAELLLFLINSRPFFLFYMDSFSNMHNLSVVFSSLHNVPMTGTYFLHIYLAYHIFKPIPIEENFKKMKLGFFGP